MPSSPENVLYETISDWLPTSEETIFLPSSEADEVSRVLEGLPGQGFRHARLKDEQNLLLGKGYHELNLGTLSRETLIFKE